MHISRSALLAALAGLVALAPSAVASDAQSVDTTKTEASWTGAVGSGLNTSYFLGGTGPIPDGSCANEDELTACDSTLVRVSGIVGEGSTVTFRIDGFQPVSDFDLRVYTADAEGNIDSDLGSPTSTDAESGPLGADDPRRTSAGDYENKVVDLAQFADYETGEIDQYFVVQVPYFLVAQDSYDGHATLDAKPFVAPEPEPEFED